MTPSGISIGQKDSGPSSRPAPKYLLPAAVGFLILAVAAASVAGLYWLSVGKTVQPAAEAMRQQEGGGTPEGTASMIAKNRTASALVQKQAGSTLAQTVQTTMTVPAEPPSTSPTVRLMPSPPEYAGLESPSSSTASQASSEILPPPSESPDTSSSTESSGTSRAGACADPDGGLNTDVSGKVSYGGTEYADYCAGDAINEYYCHDGAVNVLRIICGNGCEGGACRASSEPASSTSAD